MSDISFEYEPREHFMPLHERSERWAALVVHRRGGKTVACVNELIARATYTQKKDARYAYIAPFYRQAKDVAWQYVKNYSEGVATKVRESELRIELFNGAWITLYGADNPDALRGLYFDGVVLDEYGDCRPSLWGTVVLPTLADRKGWAIFIGTPKGKNHFYEVAKRAESEPNWYHLRLKASESGIIDDEELKEMKAQMSAEEYQQEMECDFTAAVKGTYYASQIQKMEQNDQIAPHSLWNKKLPVSVASDIGFTDSTAMWFWQPADTPGHINIIDYHEADGKEPEYYFELLEGKPYTYDNIWLPHDAKAKTFATKRSTIEQFLDHFKIEAPDTNILLIPRLAIQHGIDAARKILKICHIDSIKCHDGIEALRAYRRQYSELTKAYVNTPFHDWSSHGADGFRYLSLVCTTEVETKTEAEVKTPVFKIPEYCLDDLWEDNQDSYSTKYSKLRM